MLSLVSLDEGTILEDLFTPENLEVWAGVEDELRSSGRFESVVSPVTALEFTNNMILPRGEPERDADGNIVALGEIDPEGSPADQRGRRHPARRRRPATPTAPRCAPHPRLETLARITAIPVEDRVIGNAEWNNFLIYDNEGEHPEVAAAVLPRRASTPRWSCASRATRTSRPRARPPRSPRRPPRPSPSRARRSPPPAPPILLRDLNDYLTGGMLMLGAIAVAIMVLILADLLRRPVAAAAPRRDPRRPRLGVRPRRLPRHPAHHRHHRRPPGDARHRHRLRDPGPRPGGGGGRHRPRSTPDPGDGAQPRAGAARRHLRRRVRLPGPALRRRADDPGLRPAARRRHRRHLHLQHRAAASRSSASASTSRPPRAATSARARSAGSSCGSARCRYKWAPGLLRRQHADLRRRRRRWRSELDLQTDPVEWVNQDTQVIKDIQTIESEVGSSSELGVFVQSDDVFSDETVEFVHDFVYDSSRSTRAPSRAASSRRPASSAPSAS